MKIIDIIKEINKENGTKYKILILQQHKNNILFKKILSMTYDKVKYTYNITLKNINVISATGDLSLDESLNILEKEFCSRLVTGNNAIKRLEEVFNNLNEDNQDILSKIINRDLKINIGSSVINKVFKGLITKPVYMRCGIFSQDTIDNNGNLKKGTVRHITINKKEKALIQLKADGTYREISVDNGNVSFISRSGEDYYYPNLAQIMSNFPNGKYIGELEVIGCKTRSEGNGLINSDNIPYDKLSLSLWDYIIFEEYNKAKNKEKCSIPYIERFQELRYIVNNSNSHNIKTIETYEISTIQEALKYTSMWMSKGLEGGVLKDRYGVLKDGTSNKQLKLKLQIEADVRITGFTKGTKGTSRENTFGAITFTTDDGMIKGQTSGFSDSQLIEFNNKKQDLIGQIMVVQFNDITKARDNNYYALSHPRFICIRTDKEETDDMKRIFELRDMAMNLI